MNNQQSVDTRRSPVTRPINWVEIDDSKAVIKRKRVSFWIVGAAVVGLLAWLAWAFVTNPRVDWGVFGKYLFSPRILQGLLITIQLSLIAMLIAIVLGFIIAMLMRSENPVLRAFASGYVGFFRGLPLLVLLLFTYNLALFAPTVTIGFPPVFGVSLDTNSFITGFSAAIIGLALHESAFMAEIIRGGLLAVPPGQHEAAIALGMRGRQSMMSIVLPQAIRVIIPATGNLFILLLKASSLVAVIGGGELLTMAQRIYGQNFQVIPLLLVVSFWYLTLVLLASLGQRALERRMGRSVLGGSRRSTAKEEQL